MENDNLEEDNSIELKEINKNESTYSHIMNSNNPLIVISRNQWIKFRNLNNNQQMMTFSFVFICLMLFGILDNLIYCFICLFYPVWGTLYSIKQSNNDNYLIWLVYWIVYSFLQTVEYILPLYNLPYYTTIKTITLFVCFMPQSSTINKFTSKYSLTNLLVDKCNPYLENIKKVFIFIRLIDSDDTKED